MNSPKGHFFELAKRMLFTASVTEGTAETIGTHNQADITFKRVAELQLELVKTIELTLNSGLIRSAYSQLRTSLELCTSFSWLSKDIDERYERFALDRPPKIQSMMNELEWQEEYDKTYRTLSKFVHGNSSIFDVMKEIKEYEDINEIDEIDDTITSDYFLNLNENSPQLVHVDNISLDKLIQEHQPIIELKMFDIVLVNLVRASGAYSDSFNWWPGRNDIEVFSEIVNLRKDDNFLWRKEREQLAICRVEGVYA